MLKGDISIVGPDHCYGIGIHKIKHKLRFKVMPGITGYSQIYTNSSDTWKKRFELDIWYVKNRNFILDLKIIVLTIKKIVISIFIKEKNNGLVKKFNGKN